MKLKVLLSLFAFLPPPVLAASSSCIPTDVLRMYYEYQGCTEADPRNCKFSVKNSQVQIPPSLGFKNLPSHFPYPKGSYIQFHLANGQTSYGQVEGVLRDEKGRPSELIVHNPVHGSMKASVSANGDNQITKQEYELKMLKEILYSLGLVNGAAIEIKSVKGAIIQGVVDETKGDLYDRAENKILVMTKDGLKKIDVTAIKNLKVKKTTSLGLHGVKTFLKGFSGFNELISKIDLPVAVATAVIDATPVACAELSALLFTNLDPKCGLTRASEISESFKHMQLSDQWKILSKSPSLCRDLEKFLTKQFKESELFESLKKSHVTCEKSATSFESPTNLWPDLIIPGHLSGYSYKQQSLSDSKESYQITVKPVSCNGQPICLQQTPKDGSNEIQMVSKKGSLSSLRVQGKEIDLTDPSNKSLVTSARDGLRTTLKNFEEACHPPAAQPLKSPGASSSGKR